MRIELKTRVAWWVPAYLQTLCFVAAACGCEPDTDMVAARLVKVGGIRVVAA